MTDYSPWKRLLLELQHELEARQVCIAAHGRAVVPIDSEAQAVARGNDEWWSSLDQHTTTEPALI